VFSTPNPNPNPTPPGTTGNPKGVMYSHRSNMMHALITVMPDALALGSDSTMLVRGLGALAVVLALSVSLYVVYLGVWCMFGWCVAWLANDRRA